MTRRAKGLALGSLVLTASPLALIAAIAPATAQTIGQGATVQTSKLGTTASPVFQGGTLVVDQTGTFSNNFTLGAATATQLANTVDAHGNVGTFSGIFSDVVGGAAGDLVISDTVGGGRIVLTGANTYDGPTTINAGAVLALSGTGNIPFSSNVQNSGTFDISATTQGTQINSLGGSGTVLLGAQALNIVAGADIFTGTISGSGSLTVTGGTETLDGANLYTGGTIIASGGALVIGDADTNGSILGNIADSGTFEYNRTDAITFSQTISGTGNFTLTGGTLTFTTPQTYTGTTTISAGTLLLSGNGAIAGSSSVVDLGTFDISATSGASIKSLSGGGSVLLGAAPLTITAGNGIFSGVISGSGGLTVSGGAQIFTGTNLYTGGTSVTGGSLQLGDGTTTGTVPGNISDAGTVMFNYSGPQSFSAVISGTGQVKLLGGTFTINTPQTYSGMTTISAGTLVLSGSGSIASSQGVTVQGGLDISGTGGASIQSLAGTGLVQLGAQTLTITNGQGILTGFIQGSGGVTLTGGSETFAGVNLYTGPTLIAAGTLSLNNISSLAVSKLTDNGTLDISNAANPLGTIIDVTIPTLAGSGTVTLGNRTLVLTAAADTFSGSISGAGNVTVNAGTETLTGASSYTGATTIASPATLVLAGGGALSASTAVAVAGTFDISAASADQSAGSLLGAGSVVLGARNLTLANGSGVNASGANGNDFSGVISGSGGLVVSGGTQILSGTNLYTGGTSITGGTLQLGDGSSGGSIVGGVADAGTLAFDYAGTVVFSGAISGTGSVTQAGSGITVLTATSSYTGGTLISGGTLQVGNGGTAGAITGDVVDNAALVFDRSDTVTFSGAISGIGSVSQIGTGTLILSGAGSYTGATTIASGATLALGSATAIASSSGVTDNGVLDISGTAAPQISALSGSGTVVLGVQTLTVTSGAGSFAGTIAGTGGVAVSGGTQTLAGVNSYTGATNISGGTLSVTGSIASSSGVTVGAGGTLSGTGTVSQVAVASGGTLAPGVSGTGTLNAGAVSFASGSDFLVNLSSSSAPSLAVSGAASLGGNISVASANGTYPLGQRLTVLTAAGGVSGSFTAAPVASKGAQFASSVSTDANDVFLTINLAKLSPLLPAGVSRNQVNAVAGVDAGIAAGSVLPAAFNNLANQSSTQLAGDARQLAGELGADVALAGNAFYAPYQDAVFTHLGDMRQNRSVRPAKLQSHPDVWGAVIGGSQMVSGNTADGSQKLSANAVGLVVGMDWPVEPNLLVGGVLSFGSEHFHPGGGLGEGKATAYALGAYGLMQFTPRIYGELLGTIAENSVTTSRTLTAEPSTDVLGASLTSQLFGARYETGVDMGWITPYLALEDRLARTPGYAESASSGSGDFALNYAGNNVNTAGVELGLRNETDLPMNRNWVLHLSDRLAWEHDFFGTYAITANYVALPGSQFTSFGAQPGNDSALLSLGAEARSRYGVIFGLDLESAVSHKSQSYYGMGHFGFAW